jgi:hypothetical protein
VHQFASLLTDALKDPKLKQALTSLVGALCHDPEVLKMVSELTVKVIAQQEVQHVSNSLQKLVY